MSNLGENINDKLRNYEVEVDQDALWSALEPHVPKPEKKRRLLIIWFLGLGSLFLLYLCSCKRTNIWQAKVKLHQQRKLLQTQRLLRRNQLIEEDKQLDSEKPILKEEQSDRENIHYKTTSIQSPGQSNLSKDISEIVPNG